MPTGVVDGNYLLHRCCHANSTLRDRRGRPTGGTFGFLNSLQKELRHHDITTCVVVFDAGISKRRRSIYEPYKGNRYRAANSAHYVKPDDKKRAFGEQFGFQLGLLRRLLSALGVYVIRVKGWEADDLVYRIATQSSDSRVYVISDDKDYYQLVRGSVQLVRPMAKEILNRDNFAGIVGYPVEQYLLRRSIEGDPSDKIPGIKGVGPKCMQLITSEYVGSWEYPFGEFFEYCVNHDNKKVLSIVERMDEVFRNVNLMDLEREPYPEDVRIKVNDNLSGIPVVDAALVRSMMLDLDMHSKVKELHTWIVPFKRLE